MALSDLIKSLIAGPVTSIAGPLRTPIIHTSLTGTGTYGPIYSDTPVNRTALVEYMSKVVTDSQGNTHVSTAKFTFFEQFVIQEGDLIELNGVTSTIVAVSGLLDPDGLPYLPEAFTGK
jgi:hypothetical protein